MKAAPRVAPEAPCNLCDGSETELIGTRDRRGRPLRTVLCRGCGLVFSDPRPEEAAEQAYYRDRYRQEYKGVFTPRPAQAYRGVLGALDRIARIEHLLRPGAAVLDVGSGAGEFPYVLRSRGYAARAVEPDRACAEFARERLRLNVESRPLAGPAPQGGPFDVITLFHVLEHLVDPRGALRLLATWLAGDGRLVVEVPNVETRTTAPHHRFHRAHLYGFNAVTLAAAGESAGLRAVEHLETPDGGTITAVFARGESRTATDRLAVNSERVRRALDGYTNARHYLGGTVLRQQLRKFRRNARIWRVTRGLSDPVEAIRLAAQTGAHRPS